MTLLHIMGILKRKGLEEEKINTFLEYYPFPNFLNVTKIALAYFRPKLYPQRNI